jgi:hypothetical protein
VVRTSRLAVLVGSVLAFSCGQSAADVPLSEGSSSVRDSAGVRVVAWGEPPSRWRVSDQPILHSGTLRGRDADALHGIQSVVPVDSLSALVVESQPARILHLDFAGGDLRDVGGTGAGPGEFTSILWAGRRSDGGYLVYDTRLKRLSVLAPDLRLVAVATPPVVASGPGALPDIRGEFADGRLVATSPLLGTPAPGSSIVRQPWRVFALDTAGALLDSLTTVLGDEALVVGGVVARPPFLKRTQLVVTEREVHVADAKAYEFRSYGSDGRALRVVRGKDRRREVPDSALRRFRQMGESVLPGTVFYPEVSGLLVDDGGRLWLGRFTADAEPEEWSVTGSTGELIATLEMPRGFRLRAVWRGLLWGVGRGPLGEESVQAFGLQRP